MLILVGSVCLPPIIEFVADSSRETMYLAYHPFRVVGVFVSKADALESLRPHLRRLPPGQLPKHPHCFNALAASPGAPERPPTYAEAAMMALMFPKHRKPLPPDAPLTPASDYLASKAKALPRMPGGDFKELIVAAEVASDKPIVIQRVTWP